MKAKRLTHVEYLRIYRRVPRICVELIIKSKQGVVLVKRGLNEVGPDKGKWHLPGKTIYYGETVAQALRRTARDETGLRVQIVRFLGYHQYPPKAGFGSPLSLFFLAKPLGGTLRDRDGREIAYFEKLPRNMGFGHARIIKKFRQ
jgi:ADP-ribose pyrophosphatase YjhB (NUDIX family)